MSMANEYEAVCDTRHTAPPPVDHDLEVMIDAVSQRSAHDQGDLGVQRPHAEVAGPRTLCAVAENAPQPAPARAPEREITPLDPPMVPFAIGGIVVWAVLGLVLLGFQPTLVEQGRDEWLWICLAGFLWGFPGLAVMMTHDANRRRRRVGTQP